MSKQDKKQKRQSEEAALAGAPSVPIEQAENLSSAPETAEVQSTQPQAGNESQVSSESLSGAQPSPTPAPAVAKSVRGAYIPTLAEWLKAGYKAEDYPQRFGQARGISPAERLTGIPIVGTAQKVRAGGTPQSVRYAPKGSA